MALLFCDSFDCYSAVADIGSKWASVVNAPNLQYKSTSGKFGGGCLSYVYLNTSPSNVTTRGIGVSFSNTINTGFWWNSANPTNAPSTSQPMLLNYPHSANANGSFLGLTTNGIIQVYRMGSTPTVAATGTRSVADGNWHWIEVQVVASTTASGSITVYVDGTIEIAYTGITLLSAITAVGNVLFNGTINSSSQANGPTWSMDDVIVWDNTGSFFNTFPLGPRRIAMLTPGGAGDSQQFTPSSGTNVACVTQPYSGTAFVSDNSTGKSDLYNVGGLTYTPQSKINAVVTNVFATDPSGSGTRNVISKLKSAGSVVSASPIVLGSTYINYQTPFYQDSTGANFTPTTVNASEVGMGD